ncbi:hypothetical protein GQ53DRAFT_675392, partial [Thozetella sp. PMI_491]
MAGCITCRQRKVRCDGRPELCLRCEKLGLQCIQEGSPLLPPGPSDANSNSDLTQAGHKRLRIPIACESCRKKKLKCDAQRPACSSCVRKQTQCLYVTTGRRWRGSTSQASPRAGYV